ncbi:stage V sporulation protein AB [Blautia liquoris]|uniref:Stage V sporulation protein AB n=1 Tax=Blautia liquoris TaxID=2779518 RepID=A0A7M2RHE0_9FIRM|nr:stage V sporulation protein AB [Blautia liquoris]QOV19753.1 stage V sporulation protein AB [Blautia liquoris]
MWQQFLMGGLGLVSGFIIASGTVAFIISLGVVPRYAGITRTADKVMLYENCCIFGAILGNVLSLYRGQLPLGTAGLAIYGIFAGIFLGGWVIALGEVVDIYAILARRAGLTRGIPIVIVCMALGKALGSLFYFFKGWAK